MFLGMDLEDEAFSGTDTMSKATKALIDRWKTPEMTRLAHLIISNLHRSQSLALPGLGVINGRLDLRGLTFPPRSFAAGNSSFDNVDLSWTKFCLPTFNNCSFNKCIFDYADLSSLRQWNSNYSECSFRETNFSNASFGAHGGIYLRCIFDEAKFTRAIFIRPRFEHCVFNKCKLKGVDFNGCSFVKCKFVGVLEDVQFHGHYGVPYGEEIFGPALPNLMTNVDFSEASLRMVGFHDQCDLSTVILPNDRNHILIKNFSKVIQAAEQEYQKISDKEIIFGRKVWLSTLKSLSINQDMYIVNKQDLAEKEGNRFAEYFIGLLKRYELKFSS